MEGRYPCAQHCQVRQHPAAVGDHRRRVGQDLASGMHRGEPTPSCSRRQPPGPAGAGGPRPDRDATDVKRSRARRPRPQDRRPSVKAATRKVLHDSGRMLSQKLHSPRPGAPFVLRNLATKIAMN
jgi:hypothetical protein